MPTTPETPAVDWQAQVRQQRDADSAKIVADIFGVGVDLYEVAITEEYELQKPVRLFSRAEDRFTREVTRIRVRAVADPQPPEDGDTSTYFTARGWSYPLTKSGERSKAENPSWSYLPDELAERILGDRAPRVDTSSSVSRQHYIDTGRYLLVDPADAEDEDGHTEGCEQGCTRSHL